MSEQFNFGNAAPPRRRQSSSGSGTFILAGIAVFAFMAIIAGALGYAHYHSQQQPLPKPIFAKDERKKKEPAQTVPEMTDTRETREPELRQPINVQQMQQDDAPSKLDQALAKPKEPTAKEWLDRGIEASKKRRIERPRTVREILDLADAESAFMKGIKVCGESREDQLIKAELWLRLSVVRNWKDGFPDNDAVSRANRIMTDTLKDKQQVAIMRNEIIHNQYGILRDAQAGKSK